MLFYRLRARVENLLSYIVENFLQFSILAILCYIAILVILSMGKK